MRSVELAKVAAAAESLRLQRMAARQGMRAAYGAGAAVFGIGVLVLLHVILFYVLTPAYVTPVLASVILLVIDAVIAGILFFLAKSSAPDAIEEEALAVRRLAVVELRRATTFMALAGEAIGATLRSPRTRAGMVAHLASRFLRR